MPCISRLPLGLVGSGWRNGRRRSYRNERAIAIDRPLSVYERHIGDAKLLSRIEQSVVRLVLARRHPLVTTDALALGALTVFSLLRWR